MIQIHGRGRKCSVGLLEVPHKFPALKAQALLRSKSHCVLLWGLLPYKCAKACSLL